jgi:hypothetical protein
MLGGSIRKLKSSAVAALVAAALAAASPSLAQSTRDRVLVVAVATTPASVDSEQAPTAEGETMMANTVGGDLFAYKVVKNSQYGVDEVDLKSVGDQGVVGGLPILGRSTTAARPLR